MSEKHLKQDYKNLLALKKVPLNAEDFNELSTGEELIEEQLSEMKREQRLKKLYEYQINKNTGNVNDFLLNRYSDNGPFHQPHSSSEVDWSSIKR